jgi:hypothetical protein
MSEKLVHGDASGGRCPETHTVNPALKQYREEDLYLG